MADKKKQPPPKKMTTQNMEEAVRHMRDLERREVLEHPTYSIPRDNTACTNCYCPGAEDKMSLMQQINLQSPLVPPLAIAQKKPIELPERNPAKMEKDLCQNKKTCKRRG